MRRLTVIGLCAATGAGIPACASSATTSSSPKRATATRAFAKHIQAAAPQRPHHRSPLYPRVLPAARSPAPTDFVPAVRWNGRTAVWIARRSNLVLLSFDQRLELRLHSGTIDAGAAGWRYGPAIAGRERLRLVAAFNGGFKLDVGAGGFESYGRSASTITDGLGSIVTYSDGTTEIGAWHAGVPTPGKRVASVRQNLHLLIDHGRAAPDLACVMCWGATLGGVIDPARSALGITGDGRLVWAAGENLTVHDLAGALIAAHVKRAVELDINPEWVAGYLYAHRGAHGAPRPLVMVAGQQGVPGQFLTPYSRDFFTLVAR